MELPKHTYVTLKAGSKVSLPRAYFEGGEVIDGDNVSATVSQDVCVCLGENTTFKRDNE